MRRSMLVVVCAVLLAPAAARADLALSFGEGGLRIGRKVVFSEPVDGAAYDPAQQLIWFRSSGTLQVIDLRDPKGTAIPIATKLPEEGAFAITGASKAGFLTGTDEWVLSYPSLSTGRKTRLAAVQAGDFGTNGAADADAARRIKKAKLVGAKWLKTLAKRAPRPTPPHLINATSDKVALPDTEACDDADACGVSTTLGNSKYRVVVTSASYGPGALVTMCDLYDPATKRFANPVETGGWTDAPSASGPCANYAFASDGKRYLVGSTVCVVRPQDVVCQSDPDGFTFFGWADSPPAAP